MKPAKTHKKETDPTPATTKLVASDTLRVAPWLETPEWQGRDVFVAFPCYKTTNPATAWCLQALAMDLTRDFLRFDVAMGDAMVYHARNGLADRFMATECSTLLFIDDDIIFPVGRPDFLREVARLPSTYPAGPLALHTLHRLKSHAKGIVGATYYERNPKGRAVNSLRNSPGYRDKAERFVDELMPTDWVGTGCTMIQRQVFLDIQAKFPELAPTEDHPVWNYFSPDTDGAGEDVAFCRRAAAAGHQTYVDCALHALHVGYAVYGVHNTEPSTL